MSTPNSASIRALKQEFKSLQEQPVEGFRVKLVNDEDMFNWEVSIFGPPDTLYQGGYFKALMKFPNDYPYSPPTMNFISKFWHPNVYEDGRMCISILHPPGNDPRSGELPSERWNPTQNVSTILLSVISLISEPNISSPANVDASVMFRRWKDSNGEDEEYKKIVTRLVEVSKVVAKHEGIVVPTTIEDYCTPNKKMKVDDGVETLNFCDSDYEANYDEDEENDDSGEVAEDSSEVVEDGGGSDKENEGNAGSDKENEANEDSDEVGEVGDDGHSDQENETNQDSDEA